MKPINRPFAEGFFTLLNFFLLFAHVHVEGQALLHPFGREEVVHILGFDCTKGVGTETQVGVMVLFLDVLCIFH